MGHLGETPLLRLVAWRALGTKGRRYADPHTIAWQSRWTLNKDGIDLPQAGRCQLRY